MTIRFTSRVEPYDGPFQSAVLPVPEDVAGGLPSTNNLRVEGTMNDAPFALAIQRRKDGRRLFILSKRLRKEAGVGIGDVVKVVGRIVDSETLHVPEELQALLDVDDDARKLWDGFTTGVKRGLCHYVGSVKSVDARIRRALQIMERARNRELSVQQQRKK